MATSISAIPETAQLASLPLGLLLGRISGQLRHRLLAESGDDIDDVRLIGLVLAIRANSEASQADHARLLGVDVNTASRLVNRAETRGFVQRVVSPDDKRAFTLSLTEEGLALAADGARAVADTEARLVEEIGQTEIAVFRATAERMLRALDQQS